MVKKLDARHLFALGSAIWFYCFGVQSKQQNQTAKPKAGKCPTSHFFAI